MTYFNLLLPTYYLCAETVRNCCYLKGEMTSGKGRGSIGAKI